MKAKFKTKLKDSISGRKDLPVFPGIDSICGCIVESADKKISVREYLMDDYTGEDRFYKIIAGCMVKQHSATTPNTKEDLRY
jgi:hypothetical protein